ncbi:MAG: YIP1 family protein [Gemmatimonadales bacterium]
MTDPAGAPAAPQPEKANLIDDFLDIFGSPATVFARRAAANPMPYFLIVSLLLIGMFFVNRNMMAPIMDAEMQKGFEAAMKQNPQLTPEVVEKSKAMMMSISTITVIVVLPCSLLLLALVAWIVGKLLGGTLSYGTALLISSFAWLPRVVEAVINSVQGLLMDVTKMTSHYQLTLSAARFLDAATASPMMLALTGRVDLITLWVTALFAVGLVYAGKVPKAQMIVAGLAMWVIGAIPAVWGALRAG